MRLATNKIECTLEEVQGLLPEKLLNCVAGLRAIINAWGGAYEISGDIGRMVFVTCDRGVEVRVYPRYEPVGGIENVPACVKVIEELRQTDEFATLVRYAEIAEVVLALLRRQNQK